MPSKKVILIDGHSLVYRAFFALPTTLTTPTGQVSNAAYGFTSMLMRLIKDEQPDIIIVAFDKGRPHRLDLYEQYKAHRPQTPDDLRSQFPIVHEILCALRVPIVEIPGFEADDILATLTKKLEKENQVLIVTGDRDALQLVSPSTTILATKRGITDMKRYDREAVIERFGVPPEKMADLLGLKGDASDNIPGIPGVGEKTAAKLIQEFGSVEETVQNIDKIKPTRFQEIVKNNVDLAHLSKELALLKSDLPLDLDLDTCEWEGWDKSEVERVFTELGFNTLMDRLFAEERPKNVPEKAALQVDVVEIENLQALQQMVEKLGDADHFAVEAEITGKYPVDLRLESLAFSAAETYFLSLSRNDSKLPREIAIQTIRPVLESGHSKITTHGAKAKIHCLRNEGLSFANVSFDCEIAAYLIHAGRAYTVEDLASEYLDSTISCEPGKEQIGQRAYTLKQLKSILLKKMEDDNSLSLFEDIEMPLIPVLAKMECAGAGIDRAMLGDLSSEVERDLKVLEAEIFELAGEQFNINSSQQLSQILFEKLGLQTDKKTKTGFSTDSSVLNKLLTEHPIVEKILRYRELAKLKSTYIDALPKLINSKTGRLHTTFSQTGTTTGRLSSSNPNLQNIPVRTDLGRRVREAFVPARASDEFLVADYSQIELRILAHLADCRDLLQAFEDGEDIHRATASEVFGVEAEAVDAELRRRAKAVNFGIVYGISPVGLSEQLGISREEAKSYIDKYFDQYPEVRAFIDKTVAEAYAVGFVETMMYRRRYIPELKSSNYAIRSLGERLAINTRIQGSAADIIKKAMINLDRAIEAQGMQTRMILQVHDELVFEVPPMEREVVRALVKEKMETACLLKTRLKVDIAFGRNWRDAK